jgi:hypothetical protein
MMTVTENTANSMSQSIDYNNYSINRSYPTTTYDYHPNYATFPHPSPLFSTGTIPSMNKSYHPPTFDTISNLNHFYRRHTESPSVYSSSTSNHPLSNPFHYSPEIFFGWNNSSSLMRTHSASYQDYSGSHSYPTIHDKSRASNNPYPPYFNLIPPTNYSLPPPIHMLSNQSTKRSKINTRPRLTAHIRREILKLKAIQPTIFVWEIQQKLLQNGICTSQTVPNAAAIQRVLNESLKNSVTVKEEAKMNVNRPSVSICLSPSPSPTLSNGESVSECSICLESYRSGQEVSILACSHEYHSSCIGEWMLKSRSCPMCRKDIHNQPQFVTLLI